MIGTTIQNYQITSLLGEGGMGRVYMATDTLLGRTVAIKYLNSNLTSQPQFLERFKNEAKTLARLSHPNIALLYNYLQQDDDYFMVMEYVEGQNLDQLVREHSPLHYQLVVPLICKMLEGLDHAHRKGILHRDIKPANVMLTKDNNVKLMDFGIAKVSDAAKLTQASRVIGTIEFLAPELIEGKEPSVASDIYAVGVTMYELLTGKLPFTGKSDYVLMQDIVKQKPPAMQQFNNSIPKKLSEIILKALDKKPEKRFLNVVDFMQALQSSFSGLQHIDTSALSFTAPAAHVVGSDTLRPTIVSTAPETTVLDMRKEKTPLKPIDLDALLRNKYLYFFLASMLVIFSLFKIFSNPAPVKYADSGKLAQHESDGLLNNDSSQSFAEQNQPAVNNDSIAVILNKEKQNENNPQSTASGNNNNPGKKIMDKNIRKPEKEQPDKKPVPQPEPKPAPEPSRPEPLPISESVKLRTVAYLSLRENLTPETAQNGQAVSFKVIEPVEMRGKTVIPAGAILYGSIKNIGKIRMDLIFNSVSVQAHHMTLEDAKSSGNIRDVLSPGSSFKIGLRGKLNP